MVLKKFTFNVFSMIYDYIKKFLKVNIGEKFVIKVIALTNAEIKDCMKNDTKD